MVDFCGINVTVNIPVPWIRHGIGMAIFHARKCEPSNVQASQFSGGRFRFFLLNIHIGRRLEHLGTFALIEQAAHLRL